MGFHLSDLWAVVIGLGLVLVLANARGIYETVMGIALRYVAVRRPLVASDDDEYEDDLSSNNNASNEQQSIAITATERNALLFAGQVDALAALVHAKKIGETEGIKIVFGVSPSSTNKTYLAARAMLKARLERLQSPDYRPLTADKRPA